MCVAFTDNLDISVQSCPLIYFGMVFLIWDVFPQLASNVSTLLSGLNFVWSIGMTFWVNFPIWRPIRLPSIDKIEMSIQSYPLGKIFCPNGISYHHTMQMQSVKLFESFEDNDITFGMFCIVKLTIFVYVLKWVNITFQKLNDQKASAQYVFNAHSRLKRTHQSIGITFLG